MTRRIGIFGGTFDPVHTGHVLMAVEAREILRLDEVVVVPAARSPHKTAQPCAPDALRLACARAAFGDIPGFVVDDCELARGAPSYTIDTLDALSTRHPGATFVLIIGADSLTAFARWHRIAEIVTRVSVAVAVRPGADDAAAEAARAALPGLDLLALPTTPCGVSSTLVRARARAGLPLHGFVPDAVRELLESAQPYRVSGERAV